MHDTMQEFLDSLEAEGRASTVPGYDRPLRRFSVWLAARSPAFDPLKASAETLAAYQRFLAEAYRKPNGKPLKQSTQITWLCVLKSFYGWLYRRGQILVDPAAKLKLPKLKRKHVVAAHLSQQEATALIQTQASRVSARQDGSRMWAVEYRNLVMLALALATGRRRESLLSLRIKDLDFTRKEIRVEWEKGRAGRVLPCAGWALTLAKEYAEKARPVLLACRDAKHDPGWLFVSTRTERVCGEFLGRLVQQVQARAVEENPDLEELAGKHLSAHSLRVTFATLMFLNGCGIRVLNDLLMHRQLTTTAKYTPLEFDDLRRACRLAHPRA